jgi:hypothetical protein
LILAARLEIPRLKHRAGSIPALDAQYFYADVSLGAISGYSKKNGLYGFCYRSLNIDAPLVLPGSNNQNTANNAGTSDLTSSRNHD